MANRILDISFQPQLQDPAEVEVWVSVIPEHMTPTTEVRGRLVGPRCHYAATVEIAYPLRPFVRPPAGLSGLARRVVIPEASLWEPQCPFLYQGLIELWEEGRPCDQIQVQLGLRTLTLGQAGLRLNGRPFVVQGVVRSELSEEEAHRLRQAGINTLLVSLVNTTEELWDAGDRLGFFILCQGTNETTQGQAIRVCERPSRLGWMLAEEFRSAGPEAVSGPSLLLGEVEQVAGIEMRNPGEILLPLKIHFIHCVEDLYPGQRLITKSAILLSRGSLNEIRERPFRSSAGILGWIVDPCK